MTKHKHNQVQRRRIRFYLLFALCFMTLASFFSGYAIGAWGLRDDWNYVGTALAITAGAISLETDIAPLRVTNSYATVASLNTHVANVQATQTVLATVQQTPESSSND